MTITDLSYEELKYAMEHRIMNADEAHSKYEMSKRQDTVNRFIEEFGYQPKEIQTGKYKGAWYIELPNKDKRTKKRKKTKKEIEDLIIEFMNEYDNNPTLHELFDEHIAKQIAIGNIKIKSKNNYCQVYKRHFKDFGERRIKNVTAKDFKKFLEEQVSDKKLKKHAFEDLKLVTKKILKQADQEELIDWDYEKEVFRKLEISDNAFDFVYKEDYELVYDEEETQKVVEYCNQYQTPRTLAILLMFFTGMRIGEVVALKHDDIDPKQNSIKVRRTEIHYTDDSGKEVYEIREFPKTFHGFREIPLPKSQSTLIQRLYFMSTNTEFVFSEHSKHGEWLLSYNVRNTLRREVCKNADVYTKSPHKIRATYDTILLDNGVDNKTVTELMGHSDIRVSERNYHRNRKKLADKQTLLDNIGEFGNYKIG